MKAAQTDNLCEFGEFRLDLTKKILWHGDGKSLIKNIPRRGYLFSNETHLSEMIIERHLFEKIEIIEEDAETQRRGDACAPIILQRGSSGLLW